MNKSELITAVSMRTGLSKKDTEKTLAALIDVLGSTMEAGDKIQLAGFGTFETKDREARLGRNPHTGESIPIPAARVPVFKPGKALKEKVDKK